MLRSSKLRRAAVGLLAGLAGWLAACTSTPTNIGVGLPSVDASTGVYLLDTLTVRASTVLRDSVVTSNSSYLLVGRTLDPQLGYLTATSFFEPQLPEPFLPPNTAELDSVVLKLAADNTGYRYGDTTQTQSLVRVYRLTQRLPLVGPLYAKKEYNSNINYTTTLLNEPGKVPQLRATPRLTTIRVRLSQSGIGSQLLTAAKAGQLRTQEQLLDLLPGLVLAPAAGDKAALVRLLANPSDGGIILYYHDPTDAAGTSQTFTIQQAGGRHLFQVDTDRDPATGATAGDIKGLPTRPLKGVYAEATGQQTVVEGAIGLQTRLEFPYLSNVRALGSNLTVTGAQVTIEVPPATLAPFLPAPPSLAVSTSNLNNQPTSTYLSAVSYVTAPSSRTGLDQGSYSFSVNSYVQAVLAGYVPNNGLLLSSATPELPTRVVLGGPRHPTNKLKLKLYVIGAN